MTYEEFKKLNKKYRIACEWDDTLKECNPDSAFICCKGDKTQIYYYSEKYFRVLNIGNGKYNDILSKSGIKYNYINDTQENLYEFEWKYLDEVAKIFQAKPSPQNSVPVTSILNKNIYLRFMRNYNYDFYNNLLENNIEDRRKEVSKNKDSL